jgi:cytochrome c oxidase subunit 3
MSTTAIPTNTKWWNGGRSPFNISYGKVMMWYFLMSDAFTFGAVLISYGTIRFSVNHWADPNHVFNAFPFAGHANLPLAFVSLMTFILIFSSVTMVLAVHEGHKMNRKGVEKYMILTILGGLAFLGCQAWEWTHMITGDHAVLVDGVLKTMGTTVTNNPWGVAADPNAVAAALQVTPDANLASLVHSLGHGGAHHEVMSRAEMISTIQAATKSKRTDINFSRTKNCSLGAIKKLTTVLNTTIKLKVNLIS